jgi:hypothetical protein
MDTLTEKLEAVQEELAHPDFDVEYSVCPLFYPKVDASQADCTLILRLLLLI